MARDQYVGQSASPATRNPPMPMPGGRALPSPGNLGGIEPQRGRAASADRGLRGEVSGGLLDALPTPNVTPSAAFGGRPLSSQQRLVQPPRGLREAAGAVRAEFGRQMQAQLPFTPDQGLRRDKHDGAQPSSDVHFQTSHQLPQQQHTASVLPRRVANAESITRRFSFARAA